MKTSRGVAAGAGWITAGLVLLTGFGSPSALAADRLVLCEEFTATW